VYLGLFGSLTKLGAKRPEVVQKLVPRSRVGIFRNERTQTTPLDPKLMFWGIWYYLCAFEAVWLPYDTRCKTGRTSAKVRATKSCRNYSHERSQSTPLDPKLMFWCVHTIWVHSGHLLALRNSVQNGPNYCKSSCHEVTSEIFATNAPNPPHLTLN